MHTNEKLYEGLEPQERRRILNLFGDIGWTYVGQRENQELSREIPLVRLENGVPVEFADAYSALTMLTGAKSAARDNSLNFVIILIIAYFVPYWVILLMIAFYAFTIYYNQKQYRKALALADQFYDRTIYRYGSEFVITKPNNWEVIKRVIKF